MEKKKNPLMRFIIPVQILILFSSISLADPQNDNVKAYVQFDRSEATIGEKVHGKVVAEGPEGTVFTFPDLHDSLKPLAVTDMRIADATVTDGRVMQEMEFAASAYATGAIEIPELEVKYELNGARGSVITGRGTLDIKSVLTSGSEELADIKGAETLPPDYSSLFTAAIVAACLAAAAFLAAYLYRRFKNRKKIVPLENIFARIPPHEWAYAELEKLLGQKLLEDGQFKLFYVAIAEILKKYLEGRFRIDTMERTTEEVTNALSQAKIERKVRRDVESILRTSDQVKFARFIPTYEQSKEMIQDVYSLIDETKPLPAVQEGQSVQGGGAAA